MAAASLDRRACQRSQSCCNPSQKSALMPSTRARRSAVSGVTARFPLMTSFSRGNETPSRTAKADCVTPIGTRNSSRSISPGCVGGRCVGRRLWTSAPRSARLVVVCDFNFVGIPVLPLEADPELVVDANAVLSGSVAFQAFEAIARGHVQLAEISHPIELCQLASDRRP